MATNLRECQADLANERDEIIEKEVLDLLRRIVLEMVRGVVLLSPVDTGRFRGNWQLYFGFDANAPSLVVDPSGAAAIGKALGILPSIELGQLVVFSNHLPYGPSLEDGSSKQAPNGMVMVTGTRLANAIDGLEFELG